jgi:hypothetical protein
VHLDGVTGAEVGDIRLERGCVDVVEEMHGISLSASAIRSGAVLGDFYENVP